MPKTDDLTPPNVPVKPSKAELVAAARDRGGKPAAECAAEDLRVRVVTQVEMRNELDEVVTPEAAIVEEWTDGVEAFVETITLDEDGSLFDEDGNMLPAANKSCTVAGFHPIHRKCVNTVATVRWADGTYSEVPLSSLKKAPA